METQRLMIRGGRPLSGEVSISGSKNAVLPMLAAAVAFQQPVRIQNCPVLSDVEAAVEILTCLGAKVERHDHTIEIDSRKMTRWEIPEALMSRMRGSVFFAGPLLCRFGICRLSQPGGCPLGSRPVDFHRNGLEALGAVPDPEDPGILRGVLSGAKITLPYPSVGATENLLLAALGAEGETLIRNAAREPEIVCLCDFLRSGGCDISGDGSDTIRIHGGLPKSADCQVIPDRMEAATFACAGAAAGGRVTLNQVIWNHLAPVLQVLEQAGCEIVRQPDSITILAGSLHSPGQIETGPYPAFPTDAQATVTAALLRAEGTTIVKETVFSDRMHHIPGLNALGADIRCRDNTACVRGVEQLHGASVRAVDLRGGAALAVAALAADGETEISGLHHLLRGYEDFAAKLCALGADARMA